MKPLLLRYQYLQKYQKRLENNANRDCFNNGTPVCLLPDPEKPGSTDTDHPSYNRDPVKTTGLILDNFGFNISRIPTESELKTLNLSK